MENQNIKSEKRVKSSHAAAAQVGARIDNPVGGSPYVITECVRIA